MNTPKCLFAAASAIFLSLGSLAHAQMGKPLQQGETATSIEALYVFHTDADLDTDGDFGLQTYGVAANYKRGLTDGHMIGFGAAAGIDNYSFSDATAFGVRDPWDDIRRFALNMQYNYQLDREQSLFVMPSIEYVGESGADLSDSLRYGGIAGYVKQFSRTLTLGIGGAFYAGMEDSSGFPVILVNWQFADDWRVGNSFRPGPTTPAGLEIGYTGIDHWEFGFGAAYSSTRFALDDSGTAPEGYGDNESAVVYLRATYGVSAQSALDLFLGTTVGGELTIDDSDGDKIASEDYDPSLVLSIAYSYSF
jgi:hypothetical protein